MSALFVLAQAGAPGVSSDDMPVGIMVVLIVAAVMAVPITAIILGVKQSSRERELQHAERLKALEKGILLEDVDEERRFRTGIMRLAFGIGIVVPAIAIIGATSAVINMRTFDAPATNTMVVFLIWTGAAAVGVAGVASGAWLAHAAMARLSPGARRDKQATALYSQSYETSEAASAH